MSAPAQQQTKYGGSLLLLGARGPTATAPAGETPRLLDVDLAQIDEKEMFRSGGWVLSLEAHNDSGSALPGPATPAASLGTVLVVATITMGAGGGALPFQVTVLEGCTLLLPAGRVTVDVALVSQSGGTNMRVTGVISRGQADNNACLVQQINITSAAVPQQGAVPNFVTGLRVEAVRDSPWYSNQLQFVLGASTMLGPHLRDFMLDNEWIPVPPTGRTWAIPGKPSATEITYGTFPASLVWKVEP